MIEPHADEPLDVLVVDDDEHTHAKAREHLDAAWRRARTVHAHSSAEALSLLERRTFDVCLLARHLGPDSGLDFLRHARAAGHDLPVIVVTSDLGRESAQEASEAGADDRLDVARVGSDVLAHAIRFARAHRQVVRELRTRNAELARSVREKNVLLGMAAHDLRSPIGVIRGYAELLIEHEGELEASEVAEMLEKIRGSCATMTELIDDLLDVSAIEAGTLVLRRTPCDVALLVRGVVADHERLAAAKDIRLSFESDAAAIPAVHLDRARFEQVLANLVTNAIKYSHRGKDVTVRVDAPSASEVRVAVRDRGIGIAPEFVPKLFHPFARARRTGTSGEKSTGLGLAIAQRVVEAHGGRLEVESQLGAGSTFTVTLPR
ncbi:MAG: hybrid sensor histidine kinase/response regulator [Sandaracinus sp.]